MRRTIRSGLILALATLVWALPQIAAAQSRPTSPSPVQRYNRIARGANIDEWHRRLFDPDPTVRLEAVDSLGKDGTEQSVKPLLDATADEDPRVRMRAIDYLGTIGSPLATQVLTQYLFLSQTDQKAMQRILVALGRIRDPHSVKPIADFATKTQSEELRCGAIFALGEIGGMDAMKAVKPFADQSADESAKRVAVDAIAKINTRLAAAENAQPTLLELEKRFAPPQAPQGQR
jgi:HEAT repeat protein